MEKITLNYSTKNIPLPSKSSYIAKLLPKVESVIRRMRWKAFFHLNPSENHNRKNTYNIPSRKNPPQVILLKPFEDDLLRMVESIQYRKVSSSFQSTLRQDVNKIKSSEKVVAFADKTRNLYEMEKDQYEKLLRENITKCYKKTEDSPEKEIALELSSICEKIGISDRVESMGKQQAFITVKDHKDSFPNSIPCRLINPAKSNLGRVSKQILERVNQKIRSYTKFRQWRNTQAVIDWFDSLEEKQSLSFLTFDIVEFYPSISEQLLHNALRFASQFESITADEIEIIMHSRKSLLFDKNEPWAKKSNRSLFDVSMGSFDGAEICELVGLFALSKLNEKCSNNIDIGLYRDDGLAAIRNARPRTGDRIRKRFCEVFAELGLRITAQANLYVVNFLDVTLNLSNGKYVPYRKPDDPPSYINSQSNHPPPILKQLPSTISKRVSSLSCNPEEFARAAPTYDSALQRSGFTSKLEYSQPSPPRRNRRRNILWFNPPYSMNVRTNVGMHFLQLIDKHFPTGHQLRPVFNRNSCKVSYSCMDNIESIIKQHNAKILKPSPTNDVNSQCNCQDENNCPLNNACKTKSIVYQATVTPSNQPPKIYIGMTENEFKTRYRNHKSSFNNVEHAGSTTLSKFIWELKESDIAYAIEWKILKRANAYRSGGKICNLCLSEKICILNADKQSLLNKRSELIAKCCHERKFYAYNYNPP